MFVRSKALISEIVYCILFTVSLSNMRMVPNTWLTRASLLVAFPERIVKKMVFCLNEAMYPAFTGRSVSHSSLVNATTLAAFF